MLNFKQNEDAVSPVIGVILMVAITVILAAVIAAFVFGMTGNVQGTKTVSIGSKLDDNHIVLTINGGPDLPTLQQLTITVNGAAATGTYLAGSTSAEISDGGKVNSDRFSVGETIEITNAATGRLLVVGKWSDGSEQILVDRTY
jgi:flagellin-like protein